MSVLTNASARGANRMTNRPKVARFPQAITKINAMVDMVELRRRLAYPDHAGVLFPVDGAMLRSSDDVMLQADGDPAYIMRDRFGLFPIPARQDFTTQDISVHALTALNGLIGESPDAVESKIEFVGWVEMGNDKTQRPHFNVIRGGAFTILYNGVRPCRQNAYLRVRVPGKEEADLMQSDKVSHAQGRHGVVTLMYEEYDPLQTNFLTLEKVYRILFEEEEHSFGTHVTKAVSKTIDAWAHIVRDVVNSVENPGALKREGTAAEVIKKLIKDAVEKPDTSTFITTYNQAVQQQAFAIREQQRMIVGKTNHAARNGDYVSIQGGRYSY